MIVVLNDKDYTTKLPRTEGGIAFTDGVERRFEVQTDWCERKTGENAIRLFHFKRFKKFVKNGQEISY